MTKTRLIPFLLVIMGCAGAAARTEAPAEDLRLASAPMTVRPNAGELRTHLVQHVQYPSDRDTILATCADSPEFTAAEKAWMSENLPQGTYENADEVLSALQ